MFCRILQSFGIQNERKALKKKNKEFGFLELLNLLYFAQKSQISSLLKLLEWPKRQFAPF